MMKKSISFLLAVVFAVCLCVCTVSAAEPRWANTTSISPTISASSYYSTVRGVSGVTKISCTLVLYEKGWLGSYSEVSRTSDTYNGQTHTFTGSYSTKSGKTYKLETTATVTRNGVAETATDSFVKSF